MSFADHQALNLAERASTKMHSTDYSAHALGIEVQSIKPGYAELTMTVRADFVNGYGVCQGGLISTLADAAFAHACNSYNRRTVAQHFAIDFIRPANVGEQLLATANEQSRGKLTGVYHVTVTNSDGKLIALFNGTSFEVGGAIVDD